MSGNIPSQCFSCGKPIGHLIYKYITEKQEKHGVSFEIPMPIPTQLLTSKKTEDGELMDRLGLKRHCCRTMALTFPQTMAASING